MAITTPLTALQNAQAGSDTTRVLRLATLGLGRGLLVVTGAWTGTLTPRVSGDNGATWPNPMVYPIGGGPGQLTITANGTYLVVLDDIAFLACDAAVGSGAVTVQGMAEEGTLSAAGVVPGATQHVVTYGTHGTFDWVVPANVKALTIRQISSAGGGGGGGQASASTAGGGGGGSAGAVINLPLPVTPGNTITFIVGQGGAGGAAGSPGGGGGASQIGGQDIGYIYLAGPGGGAAGAAGVGGAGGSPGGGAAGAGGTYASFPYPIANGGGGGGGGDTAGVAGAGGGAPFATGGNAGAGNGAGGGAAGGFMTTGANGGAAGVAGSSATTSNPGSGGGGGGANAAGGNGADGYIQFEYWT